MKRKATFFITGASGSGKTTLVRTLKEQLPFAEVHDFDELGVPNGGDETWRKSTTDYWLKEAKKSNRPFVVCGVSVPKEIRDSKFYSPSLNLHYGFIYIGKKQITERLSKRKYDKKLISRNISWEKHLCRYVKAEKGHLIVDGSSCSPAKVAQEFSRWIVCVLASQ